MVCQIYDRDNKSNEKKNGWTNAVLLVGVNSNYEETFQIGSES